MKALALVVIVAASSCATSQVFVPPEQASRLERTLVGERRFLRVSMFGTPFFGDATRKLLTPVAPDQVRLLENPNGSPVNPGPVEATFPVATAVRVRGLEFPSAMVMGQRVLFTPRSLIWVTVELAGAPKNALPFVLVLRPGLRSEAEVLSELERVLSKEDPSPRLEAFSESVREAVRTKRALPEMPAEALEMAWGAPESRRIELVGAQRRETWQWAGKRSAKLVDGRVVDLTDH
jgi:hypothetical protein